jgi:hypothetical protein
VVLTPEIKKHLTANMNISKKQIMISNFLGGLSWGLGTVIGATVIVAILVAILRVFYFIPGLDGFLNQVAKKG